MAIQPIVTGILSYGMSGRVFHAPFIEQHENFKLHAIVERSNKLAHLDYPSIISYNDVDELIADPDIELVIVNTPNDTHLEFARQALLGGKHVLVEKPFAPTADEARDLFALAESVGKKVLPFHNRRFDSDFLSLKHVVDNGLVGKPIELHLRFDRFKPDLSPKVFKETSRRAASGVMYDLGSHLLDQVISLFGKPKAVTKIQSKHRQGTQVDDYASLILNYSGGLNVFITTSLLVAHPQKSFVLHGTKGSFVKDRSDVQESQLLRGIKPMDARYGREDEGSEGLLTLESNGILQQVLLPGVKGDYMLLFEELAKTIRHDIPYFISNEEILMQLEILSSSN